MLSTGELTPLGREMAAFPLAPVFAYMVLRSRDFCCSREIITLVALLSADNLFYTPREDREKAARARRKCVLLGLRAHPASCADYH